MGWLTGLTHSEHSFRPTRSPGQNPPSRAPPETRLEFPRRKEQPDVVLLDVMMPAKSGWEVARALKQDPLTSSIKIVMVTAIGVQVNELTSPLYGADAYVDKPFEFDRLEAVLRDVTSR